MRKIRVKYLRTLFIAKFKGMEEMVNLTTEWRKFKKIYVALKPLSYRHG